MSFSPAPSLTLENVLKEVKGVSGSDLYCGLNDNYYPMNIAVLTKDTVEKFLQGRCYSQPSWRALIFALDVPENNDHANRIRHYAEPVQGRYMLCD